MIDACIVKQAPRRAKPVFLDHDPAWQNTQAALDNTHIDIEHRMADAFTAQQSLDEGNQDRIISAQQFNHVTACARWYRQLSRGRALDHMAKVNLFWHQFHDQGNGDCAWAL